MLEFLSKMNDFAGDVVILGKTYRVLFKTGEGLVIVDAPLGLAQRLLEEATRWGRDVGARVEQVEREPEIPALPPAAGRDADGGPGPRVEEAGRQDAERYAGAQGQEASAPHAAGGEPEPPTKAAEPAPAPGGVDEIPDRVAAAASLRDVWLWLIERYDCRSAADLAAQAARLRDRVPILKSTPNLEHRAARAAQVFIAPPHGGNGAAAGA